MKKFELSIGQAIKLTNKCKAMLSSIGYNTPKETKSIIFKYSELAEKQLHRQGNYMGNIFSDLESEIRIAVHTGCMRR